jgi:hypothetical protein
VRLHAPRRDNARIACAGGNFADHAAAMAVKMRRRPYEGDAYQEIRKAGFWGFWKLARDIVGPVARSSTRNAAVGLITRGRSQSCSASTASI